MITHVSYSMMNLWQTCRECFKYKYILLLKGEIPDYFEAGREYHDEVDAYHKGKKYNAELIQAYTMVYPPEYRKLSELWLEDLNHGLPVRLPGVELPIKGKIDGITETGLADLKYMKGKLSQRQADESDQAAIYIAVYAALTGKRVAFEYNIIDKVTGKASLVKTNRPAEYDEILKLKINNFIEEVKLGDYTALPGTGCHGHCEYYNICTNCGNH